MYINLDIYLLLVLFFSEEPDKGRVEGRKERKRGWEGGKEGENKFDP